MLSQENFELRMGQGGRGNFSSYKLGENLTDLDGDASSSGSSSGNEGEVVHFVSKLDTLAGIAIKYGVEVADIKKLNGLTTDLQMFARKSLRIPSSVRHPPSDHASLPGPSTSEPQPRLGKHSFADLSGSLRSQTKRRESPPMGLLRGYYGLSDSKEGTEMKVYRDENGYQSDEEPFIRRDNVYPPRSRPKSAEPKLTSLNNVVSLAKDFVASEMEKARDRVAVRRRPKGEPDDGPRPEVTPMKNPVPRPRSSKVGVEVEVDYPPVRAAVVFNTGNRFSEGGGGGGGGGGGRRKVVEELVFKLKKSSSTPNLQEEKPGSSKAPDISTVLSQGNNSSSITIPLLDTFTRRSKAALD